MSDLGEELDFDFDFVSGVWCPVCDRAITHSLPTLPAGPSTNSHDASTAPAPSPPLPKKDRIHPQPSKPGIAHRRTKSSTKLHRSHSKSGSSTHLPALAASTPITKPSGTTPPIAASPAPKPTAGLYCSEECRRIDSLRNNFAFTDLNHSAALPPLQHHHSESPTDCLTFRRPSLPATRSSSTSLYSFSPAPPYVPSPSPTLSDLDFSTRRNSRGAEGGYSFRPSLMQRLPSSEDGSTGRPISSSSRGYSRGSSDSLASMEEGDERPERGRGRPILSTSAQTPSALSGLKRMTPISNPASTHSSQTRSGSHPRASTSAPNRVPSILMRNHSDMASRPLPPMQWTTLDRPSSSGSGSGSKLNGLGKNGMLGGMVPPPPPLQNSRYLMQ